MNGKAYGPYIQQSKNFQCHSLVRGGSYSTWLDQRSPKRSVSNLISGRIIFPLTRSCFRAWVCRWFPRDVLS